MVSFQELQRRLLETIRVRVRNGDITERGLAKMAGISQPHVHNVLKGVRVPSLDLCDTLLRYLHLSIADLMNHGAEGFGFPAAYSADHYSYLGVLQGQVGPGHPWPSTVESVDRFLISPAKLATYIHPIIMRVAADARMAPVFAQNDLAILDQDHRKRSDIDPNGLYLVKRGEEGLIRRLRLSGRTLYLVSEDCLQHPPAWEQVSLHDVEIQHVVRARVTLVAREVEWD